MTGPWSTVDEQRAALLRAASAAKCPVLSLGSRRTSVGDYLTARLDCPNGWAGARLLANLAEEDARTPGARDAALELRRGSRSDAAFVREAFDRVKALRFDREAGEVFAMGSFTLDAGGGDCDDHARAIYALLRAGGVPSRLVFLHAAKGDPSHAVAQGHVAGAWRWLETTLDANMGEHPIAAARRLGHISARSDLALSASTIAPYSNEVRPMLAALTLAGALAALTPDQVASFEQRRNTADLSPSFMRATAELARRFRMRGAQVTGEDFLAVWNGESAIRAAIAGKNPIGKDGVQTYGYGLNQMDRVEGLRAVGWLGTPAEYLALDAEAQIPYVERFYTKNVRPADWPRIVGARGLYIVNGWPALVALSGDPSAVLGDRQTGKGLYYPGFDPEKKGQVLVSDVDRWIARREAQEGARWIEARERFYLESGEIPFTPITFLGALKTIAVIAGASALSLFLARDA